MRADPRFGGSWKPLSWEEADAGICQREHPAGVVYRGAADERRASLSAEALAWHGAFSPANGEEE